MLLEFRVLLGERVIQVTPARKEMPARLAPLVLPVLVAPMVLPELPVLPVLLGLPALLGLPVRTGQLEKVPAVVA